MKKPFPIRVEKKRRPYALRKPLAIVPSLQQPAPMSRRDTRNTKLLSVAERKELVARVAATAFGKARRGLSLVDYREPTPRERAHAGTLL